MAPNHFRRGSSPDLVDSEKAHEVQGPTFGTQDAKQPKMMFVMDQLWARRPFATMSLAVPGCAWSTKLQVLGSAEPLHPKDGTLNANDLRYQYGRLREHPAPPHPKIEPLAITC